MKKIARTPKRGTQMFTILEHLQTRNITQIESAGIYGIQQLAAAVYHLRHHCNQDIRVTRHKGVRGSYAQYHLHKED